MDAKALGCEVIVAGNMQSVRARALKFRDGYLVKSGDPSDSSSAHLATSR
jgi:small subunit ribosomal protein S3e